MKALVFICSMIALLPGANSQGFNDYSTIDFKAAAIPEAKTYSADSIANYIRLNFKTDREKTRAIYSWVINNIRYDTDSMYSINWSMYPEEKIAATLRRRKGVCENYAGLFVALAVKAGIPAVVVNGYTNVFVSGNRAGHSWCAVLVEKEWYLCDPTWDNESRGNTRYFLVAPSSFIESHIPFDPLWQLLEYPLSDHEFQKGIYRSKADKSRFNFNDSAAVFLQQDSLQQMESSARRIKQNGIENERIKNWYAYNQMNIAIVYGEKDMNLYNAAVADLNKANAIFNRYVQYRNNAFVPAKPDAELSKLLDPIEGLIITANKKLNEIGQGRENFQYDTEAIRERLAALKKRVHEQQVFLKSYLAGDMNQRRKLFYK